MTLKLLTEREAAELLRLSLRQVQKLRRDGHLPHQPGPPYRYLQEDLEQYVRRRMIPASAPPPTTLALRSLRELTPRQAGRRIAAEVLAKGHNPNAYRQRKRGTD
ncbi:helix-turn-helix domain-containing protein [Phenylobacterium sp.]|uniref:helix-turn-helix domain-containing protein n=1 Tax=Phenylobacterium sp. TaxID=1871053 RepID=UPI003BA91F76